jgi:hypothetical protein
MINARIAYVLVVKNLSHFNFFKFLCGISKVAFIVWLIFKLHFGLNNDLYWI